TIDARDDNGVDQQRPSVKRSGEPTVTVAGRDGGSYRHVRARRRSESFRIDCNRRGNRPTSDCSHYRTWPITEALPVPLCRSMNRASRPPVSPSKNDPSALADGKCRGSLIALAISG